VLLVTLHTENNGNIGGHAYHTLRFWGYIPYINTNLPANKERPLNLHCTIVVTNYRGKRKVTYGAFLDIEGVFDST
jgi:hypothetical protein